MSPLTLHLHAHAIDWTAGSGQADADAASPKDPFSYNMARPHAILSLIVLDNASAWHDR